MVYLGPKQVPFLEVPDFITTVLYTAKPQSNYEGLYFMGFRGCITDYLVVMGLSKYTYKYLNWGYKEL